MEISQAIINFAFLAVIQYIGFREGSGFDYVIISQEGIRILLVIKDHYKRGTGGMFSDYVTCERPLISQSNLVESPSINFNLRTQLLQALANKMGSKMIQVD